jgi:hypothetical protein
MTTDNSDPDEPSDDSSETPSGQPRGLLERIRAIIEALGEIEQEEDGHRRASGRVDRGAARIDYNYDVSIGLGDRSRSPRDQPGAEGSARRPAGRGDPPKPVHVQTRAVSDDELVVVADLHGVTDGEPDVRLDADEPALELTAGGEVIDRIGIDAPDVTITDVSHTNRILEIRLTRNSDSGGEESTDGGDQSTDDGDQSTDNGGQSNE